MPNVYQIFDFDLPYASFSSSGTQTPSFITGAFPITYTDTDESHGGIVYTNNSQIFIPEDGAYLITFSAVGKSTAPNTSLDIWMAVNGVNVPRSNTLSRFVGSANERIITVTYIYRFNAGQYFELLMRVDAVGTAIIATAAQTTPTRPACPSIIVTVNKISD